MDKDDINFNKIKNKINIKKRTLWIYYFKNY